MKLSYILTVLVVVASLLPMGLHKVNEGHVGVYWRGGALLTHISGPGYHWKWPFESMRNIQITMQTDEVRNIPCGTSGGVVLYFDKIEVVNRLKKKDVYKTIQNYTTNYDQTWIYDKIHHAINEFCSVHTLQEVYIDMFDQLDESLATSLQETCDIWAPGIEIIAIRVTKPRIPESIRANYERMEREKTQLLIETQRQKVVEKDAHTERLRAVSQAKKALSVANVTTSRLIAEKMAEKETARIENEIRAARIRASADSDFYEAKMQVESNQARFTDEFLFLHRMDAVTSNAKVTYGDSIPTMSPALLKFSQ